MFGGPQDVTARLAPGRFAVLHRHTPAADGADEDAQLAARCQQLVEAIAYLPGVRARVGVGARAANVRQLHDSYLDACDALRLGERVDPANPVCVVDDVRLHQLLAAVGHRARARFVDVVAGALVTQPDWPVLRETVLRWCECGLNLVRAAAVLHVHRNTLVYRLDKIERLTGTALRGRRASLTLYLACVAAELDGSEDGRR